MNNHIGGKKIKKAKNQRDSVSAKKKACCFTQIFPGSLKEPANNLYSIWPALFTGLFYFHKMSLKGILFMKVTQKLKTE